MSGFISEQVGIADSLVDFRAICEDFGTVILKGETAVNDALAGLFVYDLTDRVSADDGLDVVVTRTGMRYKRQQRASGAANAKWFGLSTSATASANVIALQAALATGIDVYVPGASAAYTFSQQVEMVTPGQALFGDGDLSSLKLVRGSGAEATPVIWMKATATGASIHSLAIDGNNTSYIAPTGGSSIAFGDAVVVEADDAAVHDLYLTNCWDNGVGIIRFSSGHAGQTNGFPLRVQVTNIRGYNNGKGAGTGGGGGATVNNLTGSRTLVDNVTDNQSALVCTEDFSGGASGIYSNITGDRNTGLSAIYIGSGDGVWSNIRLFDPVKVGIWIDAFASKTTLVNFEIKSSGEEAVRLKGCSGITLIGGRLTECGDGTHDAISIDTTPGNMTGIEIYNTTVDHVTSAVNRYGVNVIGANTCTGQIVGGAYEGATTAFNNMPTTMPVLYFSSSRLTLSAPQVITTGDGINALIVAGASKAMRITTGASNTTILGVDNTGVGAFHPLAIGGLTLAFLFNGVTTWGTLGTGGLLNVTGGSFGTGAPVTKTADFTVGAAENNLINNKAGSACTVTLPAAASFTGRQILIKNIQAQAVNSIASNVVPLAGGAAGTVILTNVAGRWVLLESDGVSWVAMAGVI